MVQLQGRDRLTITVGKAARRLGLGRNAGYEAAKRGDIPVIRIGRRWLVPVAALEAMLTKPPRKQAEG